MVSLSTSKKHLAVALKSYPLFAIKPWQNRNFIFSVLSKNQSALNGVLNSYYDRLLNQFWCECYLIRGNIFKLQGPENIRTKFLERKFIRSRSAQLFSGVSIDVIHAFPDIPLSQMGKDCSFGKNHP